MAPEWTVAQVSSPIGAFRVVFEGRTLRVVDLIERGRPETGVPAGARPLRGAAPAGSAPEQLAEYFAGRRRAFDLFLPEPDGSEFDRKVYRALDAVPAGETVTYAELARRAGYGGAARAVGGAMRRNPVPIVRPCHRVVGSDGHLTGYGLGTWRKRWLLEHEGGWPLRSGTADGPKGPGQRTLDAAGRPPDGPPIGRRARRGTA